MHIFERFQGGGAAGFQGRGGAADTPRPPKWNPVKPNGTMWGVWQFIQARKEIERKLNNFEFSCAANTSDLDLPDKNTAMLTSEILDVMICWKIVLLNSLWTNM